MRHVQERFEDPEVAYIERAPPAGPQHTCADQAAGARQDLDIADSHGSAAKVRVRCSVH